MSFRAKVWMECDRCKAVLAFRTVLASEQAVKSARWDMQNKAKGHGLMTYKSMRKRTKHLCPRCADTAGEEGEGT